MTYCTQYPTKTNAIDRKALSCVKASGQRGIDGTLDCYHLRAEHEELHQCNKRRYASIACPDDGDDEQRSGEGGQDERHVQIIPPGVTSRPTCAHYDRIALPDVHLYGKLHAKTEGNKLHGCAGRQKEHRVPWEVNKLVI